MASKNVLSLVLLACAASLALGQYEYAYDYSVSPEGARGQAALHG